EILHAGIGEGPLLTAQASAIVPENPPSDANDRDSCTWPPRFRVRVVAPTLIVKSCVEVNVAVTDSFALIVMVQFPTPAQAPLQPENVEPELGTALKLPGVPVTKPATQVLPQSIPAGLLVTCPLPPPASVTERVKLSVPTPPSITVTLLLSALAT